MLPNDKSTKTLSVVKNQLKISRILHAGYVFEYENVRIAFDPIFENPFSQNCHAWPPIEFDHVEIRKQNFSAVFISHYHDDHCSFASLDLLDRNTPIYIYCVFEEMFSMLKELGFKNVHSLQIGIAVLVGEIEVIPRKALDADVDSIFQVNCGDLKVLNVVDSWIDETTLNLLAGLAPWDAVLWPFQTMREIEVLSPKRASPSEKNLPAEWIEQLQRLKPRFVVPSSCQFRQEAWSWYNHALFPVSYRQFSQEIENSVRINPGETFALHKNSFSKVGELSWVIPLGEQNVDYDFRPDVIAPETSSIAKNFPALTSAETDQVFSYCRHVLPEKLKNMEVPEYFKSSKLWQLTVYDHTGLSSNFFFLLNGSEIKSAGGHEAEVGWLTEIPIAKIYSALVFGEALTSLYIRINDCVFATEIENQLLDVDLLDDPLIRCLFTGAFGTYQKAQLQRIKALV